MQTKQLLCAHGELEQHCIICAKHQLWHDTQTQLRECEKRYASTVKRLLKSRKNLGDIKYKENQQLSEQLEKAESVIEKCLYFTSMREPDILTHKMASDSVEEFTRNYFKDKKDK